MADIQDDDEFNIYVTALNSRGEYLLDSKQKRFKVWSFRVSGADYTSTTLKEFLASTPMDVLPAILPLSDMKIYKSMDDFIQNKSPLGLGEPINGLGRSETEAIVLVLPGTEVCCKLTTWDLIRKDYVI
jgi:hypothetical protein